MRLERSANGLLIGRAVADRYVPTNKKKIFSSGDLRVVLRFVRFRIKRSWAIIDPGCDFIGSPADFRFGNPNPGWEFTFSPKPINRRFG